MIAFINVDYNGRQRIKRENARIRKQRELKSKLNKLNELKRRKKSEAQKKWRHKKETIKYRTLLRKTIIFPLKTKCKKVEL